MHKSRISGSGTIISQEGYVLTNHHVAGKATRLVCRMSNRQELEAKLIGTDPATDLAILKLDLSSRDPSAGPLPTAGFGDSDKVRVGDTVLAIGSPSGLSQSVTRGIVSNVDMISPGGGIKLDGESVGALVKWIGHDAVIYYGNSGGPLVNLQGEIVGVNEVSIGSLGGAIPSNLAKSVADELIRNGSITRSWTGLMTQPMLKGSDVSGGVLVAGVVADSPAAKAGIRAGDVVISLDGVAVNCRTPEEMPAVNRLILSRPVGSTVKVVIIRQGSRKTMDVTTVKREPARPKVKELKIWAITARDISRAAARKLRRSDQRGVLVHTVRPGGPADEAKPGLRGGDVIVQVDGKDIADLAALGDITAGIIKGKDEPTPVIVAFDRGRDKALTVVKLGPSQDDDKPTQAPKAWLGVGTQVFTRDLAKALDLKGKKGVRVTQVYPDTTAAKAGLKVGDIILKLDGTVIDASQIEDSEVFAKLIRRYPLDSEVELAIVRDGAKMDLTVPLQARPIPTDELGHYEDEDFEFTARAMSFGDRVVRELDAHAEGVVIESVERAGWAALAGLPTGALLKQIDGVDVVDIDDLERKMAKIKKDKPKRIVFFVQWGVDTGFVELEPDWDSSDKEKSK